MSLLTITQCSLSLEALNRIKDYYEAPLRSLHSPLEAIGNRFKEYLKICDDLLDKLRKHNNFSIEEIPRHFYGMEHVQIVQSITISLTEDQKLLLKAKLTDYIAAFINDQLLYKPSEEPLSYTNHKNWLIAHIIQLAKTQSLKNMIVRGKNFNYKGYHFFESILALEQERLVEIIEFDEPPKGTRFDLSSEQPSTLFVRLAVKELLFDDGKFSQQPNSRNESTKTDILDKDMQKINENASSDMLSILDCKINRNSGSVKYKPHSGKLTPQQLKLMLALEELNKKHERVKESQIREHLNYNSTRKKNAFDTLITKTRTNLGDEEKRILCCSQGTYEREFYLPSIFTQKL